MSIRKFTNPQAIDLSRGLQSVLNQNGMQAHIAIQNDGTHQLIVLGHDSPVLKYNISEKQVENLMAWGSTYSNKNAYNTFTNIVKNDFDMPDNYVSARNVGGKVVMGLHGYRIGSGEYGYHRHGIPFYQPFHRHGIGWGGDFLGWSIREQPGYHLRRINGRLFYPQGPFVAERPDGRMKPGEMRSGGYGFYYKGNQKETSQDILDNLSVTKQLKPLQAAPRPEGKAKPFSEMIDVREATTLKPFTTDRWQEVLATHGIVVDKESNAITIQSSSSKVDLKYNFKEGELEKILAPDINGENGVSVKERLDVINNIIKNDFDTPITSEMLESRNLINIELKPEVKQDVEKDFIRREQEIKAFEEKQNEHQKYLEANQKEKNRLSMEAERIAYDPQAVNGREIHELLGNYGFFTATHHGREMVIGEIRVEETAGGHHIMSAEINGAKVTHSISKEEFDKFLQLDDAHRLHLFDEVFKEVKIAHDKGGRDFAESDVLNMKDENGEYLSREQADINHALSSSVNGANLSLIKEQKGFYREIENGREVQVDDIRVEKINDDKYRMTAIIDGNEVTHEIKEKQYEKFLAVDDYQRLKLFAKLFPEVDIKTRPGMCTNVGAALLAALVAGTEVAHGIAHLTDGIPGPHPNPMMAQSATIYSKQGVVSPGEVMQHNFNAEMERVFGSDDDLGMHRCL